MSRAMRQRGFSLIELMIAITILAILMGVALPSFRTWMANVKIRTTAESIVNGLQKARGEAVARNTSVAFVLNEDSSWSVGVVNPAAAIESRPAAEGSVGVTRTVQPNGATTVTFGNLGNLVANSDASAPITQVDVSASGGSRNLRVTVGAGGNARMCDPAGSGVSAC